LGIKDYSDTVLEDTFWTAGKGDNINFGMTCCVRLGLSLRLVSYLDRVNLTTKVQHAWNGSSWTLSSSLYNLFELHSLHNISISNSLDIPKWKLKNSGVMSHTVAKCFLSTLISACDWGDFV